MIDGPVIRLPAKYLIERRPRLGGELVQGVAMKHAERGIARDFSHNPRQNFQRVTAFDFRRILQPYAARGA